MTSEGRSTLYSAVPSLIAAALLLAGVGVFYAQVPALWIPFAVGVCAGAFALGVLRPLTGLRLALFLVPLTGALPLQRSTGWFPLMVVLWLFLFAGWQARRICNSGPGLPKTPLTPLTLAWIAVVTLSAAVAMLRYVRFWPLSGAPLVEFPVNGMYDMNFAAVKGVFTPLGIFLAGPAMAWMTAALHDSREKIPRTFEYVLSGVGVAMMYGIWQSMGNEAFGNTPHFAVRGQINATFIDPNALGTCLMLTLPMAGALMWQTRSPATRITLGLLLTVSLYVLLQSGSRTGVLGLGLTVGMLVVVAVFQAPSRRELVLRAAISFGALLLLAAAGMIAFTATPLQGSSLGRRIGETLQRAESVGLLQAVYSERYGLWYRAVQVVKEWPLTGMGFGTYWTDIPNIMGIGQNEPWYRDNAASFYLQVVAEQGIAGLAAAVAVLMCLLAAWFQCAWGKNRDPFSAIACSGIPAMILLFVTGPHTGTMEVALLFWFVAGLLIAQAGTGFVWTKTWRIAAAAWSLLAVALTGLLIHASTTSLSIAAMQERARMFYVQGGFHGIETDKNGYPRRWTKKSAFVLIPRVADQLWADVYCRHPGLSPENPLIFDIHVEGEHVARLEFPGEGTRRIAFDLPPIRRYPSVSIDMTVDRTWIPADHLEGNDDRRELGVLIEDFRLGQPPE